MLSNSRRSLRRALDLAVAMSVVVLGWSLSSDMAYAQASSAGAAGADSQREAADERSLLVGFRGIAETWQDKFIVAHYRSSRMSGAVMAHVPVGKWLGVEAELGYARVPSESSRALVAAGMLEYLPMALTLVAVRESSRADVFGGIGYGMAVFTERTTAGTVSGAKPGIDLRTGVRIHTRLIRPTLRPEGESGPRGLDIELMLGRRQHHAFGVGSGFDFSAWRLGAGMVVRL